MRDLAIDVRAWSSADPATVFAVVQDRSAWPAFTKLDSVELERPGDDEPYGSGSIIRLRSGPLKPREEIVECIPDRCLSYRLLSGIPVREYRGDVELEPDGHGTSIHWRASLRPSVPGTGLLLRRLLRSGISELVGEFAAEADRRAQLAIPRNRMSTS